MSKALKLLAGIRSDAFINSGYDPAFPLDDDDLQLAEALNDAERALALVLNDCEDVKHRKPRMRFFDVESIRFALRINDDVDLLEPGECLARIGNEKLPLRLYHKVGAVLFSHEYFSRDVPVFGLFHDFARERDGRAEYEEADAQIWERLKRALIVEDATEAERRGLVPWDVPSYEPLPFVEPVFSNNPCSSACSLLPAPPLPDALPSPQSSDECREVEPSKTAPPEADSRRGDMVWIRMIGRLLLMMILVTSLRVLTRRRPLRRPRALKQLLTLIFRPQLTSAVLLVTCWKYWQTI